MAVEVLGEVRKGVSNMCEMIMWCYRKVWKMDKGSEMKQKGEEHVL